jgi:hypothetical protein
MARRESYAQTPRGGARENIGLATGNIPDVEILAWNKFELYSIGVFVGENWVFRASKYGV